MRSQDERVLDRGEAERRRGRVDDAVVRLVEVLREERGPRRRDLRRLLDRGDDEEEKDERAGLAGGRDAHVEPRARRGALGDEERARGGDRAEREGHADEPAGLAPRVRPADQLHEAEDGQQVAPSTHRSVASHGARLL